MRSDPFDRLLPIITFVVACLVFLPTVWSGFVSLGDHDLLVRNESFRGLGGEQLGWMFSTTYQGSYQPLTWLSFAIDHEFWGLSPAGYHLTNMLLHALTAGLVTTCAMRILPRAVPDLAYLFPIVRGAAVAAGLLWACHPLRVESVAWASARADVLSGALLMLSLFAYVSMVRHKAFGEEGPVTLRYLLSIAFYVLALLASPTAIGWFLVLLLLDQALGRRAGLKQRLIEKIPFAVPALVLAVVAYLGQESAGAVQALEDLPLLDRLTLAGYSVAFYPFKTLAPVLLRAHYERPLPFDAMAPELLAGAGMAACLTLASLGVYRRHPRVAQTWWAYLLLLAPVSGFAALGSHLVAERFSYVATIPLFLLFAGAGALWVAARPARRSRHAVAGLCMLVLALGGYSYYVTRSWRTTEEVFERVLAHEPRNWVAHSMLGRLKADMGQLAAAREHLKTSLESRPGPRHAERVRLAGIEMRLGQPDEATRIVDAVLKSDPDDVPALRLRGVLFDQAGDLFRAASFFRRVLEIDENDGDALTQLAGIELRRGNAAEAGDLLDRCLETTPEHPDAWRLKASIAEEAGDVVGAEHAYRQSMQYDAGNYLPVQNLARLLADQGDPSQAEHLYRQALKLDDTQVPCRLFLAELLRQQQKLEQAEMLYREALKRAPRDKEPAFQLGSMLLRKGRGGEAEPFLRKAFELDPNDPRVLTALARLLGNGGKLDEAVELLETAAEILPDDPEPLFQMAVLLERHGRLGNARKHGAEALAVAERVGDIAAAEHCRELLERISEPK